MNADELKDLAIRGLELEIERLNGKLEQLRAARIRIKLDSTPSTNANNSPGPLSKAPEPSPAPRRRRMSAEARARISEASKKRWARYRKSATK